MVENYVISVDAMGGDRAPLTVVRGLARFFSNGNTSDLRFILHGDKEQLSSLVKEYKFDSNLVEIRHAPDVISMNEKPTAALRKGRNSSMWHAVESVQKKEADVVCSAGNTGALMAMSFMQMKILDGIDRPAIAANWPKFRSTKSAIVLDLGADVRASARNLVQYAIMGSEFCRIMMNLDEKPKVALLNVGTEETKGLQHIRDASQQLKTIANKPNARFEYISFIEGSDIMTSPADVVVTDGFSGNIALKTAEGSVRFAFSVIQDTLASRSFLCKLAGWAFFPALKEAKRIIDPRGRNGGIFLGLNGAVVKSHGAADAVGVENALNLSAIVARNNLTARISEQITLLTLETDVNI